MTYVLRHRLWSGQIRIACLFETRLCLHTHTSRWLSLTIFPSPCWTVITYSYRSIVVRVMLVFLLWQGMTWATSHCLGTVPFQSIPGITTVWPALEKLVSWIFIFSWGWGFCKCGLHPCISITWPQTHNSMICKTAGVFSIWMLCQKPWKSPSHQII